MAAALTVALLPTVPAFAQSPPRSPAPPPVTAAGAPTAAPVPRPQGPAADAPAGVRVPLSANFSRLELMTTVAVLVSGLVILRFGEQMFGTPAPSLGPPAADSFDRRWANRLHTDDGSGHRFLGGVPDFAGAYVLPYLPAIAYGVDAIAQARGTGVRLSSDANADHRLIAYSEAIGWTVLAVGITKFLVGRERPYVELGRPQLAGPEREQNLSFFSSHSAVSFAAASFVALDLGRRLPEGLLARAAPAPRWLLGRALPYLAAFGIATVVAASRVIDQQHWPSDVLVGAGVGTAIAHLVYLWHFDDRGRPRTIRALDTPYSARLTPTLGGVALVGFLP